MRGGTLFSGIGAPEVSAPWVDWRWSADIDDFANAVRAHHWPEVPNLGDVAAVRDPEPVDIIVFGSPCQSFSVAGKRLGLDDPRGNLALVALALVARLRPRWFVYENVPGLLSSDDGRDFGTFLGTVAELGYFGAWWSPDAQYAGLAQRRKRVFLVGYLGDWRPPAAVLFEPESLRWNPPPSREAGEGVAVSAIKGAAIGRQPENGPQRGDFLNDGSCCALMTNEIHAVASTGPLSHCLNAGGMGRQDYETETLVAFSCKDHGADAGEVSPTLRSMGHDGSHANGGGQVAVAFNWQSGGDCRGLEPQAITMALQREQTPAVLSFQTRGSNLHVGDESGTLGANCGSASGCAPMVASGPMVRRLTPAECEKLQGFPPGFTDIPWRGGKAPDGRRYKALGNSMAVPVVGGILDRIRQYEAAA